MFGNKEMQILYHLSKGKCSVSELSKCLDLSAPEVYRKIRLLRSMDVVEGKDPISISCCPYAKRLMSLMSDGPGMAKYLSGVSLKVLVSLLHPNTLKGIVDETSVSDSHARKILKQLTEGNLILRNDDIYEINDSECPKLRPFLKSYTDYMEVSDPRITNSSELLFRDGSDIVFSSTESQGYSPTGISAFKAHGMRGMSNARGYYTTRSGELNIEMIFDDALRIAEKENDWRLRMANELFYMKNSGELNPPPKFLEIHRRIMSGDRIENWPSKQDLEDRMWMVN